MKKLEDYKKKLKVYIAIIAGFAVAFDHLFVDELKKGIGRLGLEGWVNSETASNIVVAILYGVGALFLIPRLMDYVERRIANPRIRKSILGNYWVEGKWIDRVVNQNNREEFDQYGIIDIRFDQGRVRICGEAVDMRGRSRGSFESIAEAWGERRLVEYIYTLTWDGASEVRGYAKYIFKGAPDRAPNGFTGHFCDTAHLTAFSEASKITDNEMLAKLENIVELRPGAREPALKDFIQTFYARSPGPEHVVKEAQAATVGTQPGG